MVAPIVDAGWLADHPEAVLADVRWYADGRSGREAYEAAHLPGAVFIDLDRHLAAPPSPGEGRHPLPDPEVFAAGMREAGIGDDDVVIAYDDDSGAICARLVWMLRVTGHAAALLDGGIAAWRGRREQGRHDAPAGGVHRQAVARRADRADRRAGRCARPGCSSADRYRGENEVARPPPRSHPRRPQPVGSGQLRPPWRAAAGARAACAADGGRRRTRLGVVLRFWRHCVPHPAARRAPRPAAGTALPRLVVAVGRDRSTCRHR